MVMRSAQMCVSRLTLNTSLLLILQAEFGDICREYDVSGKLSEIERMEELAAKQQQEQGSEG